MPADPPPIRFLLDEHYPPWLAEELSAAGFDTRAVVVDPELAGSDDTRVLAAAVAEGRVVVTEDVATFHIAISQLPDHRGVVFCHRSRFPRRAGTLGMLRDALIALAIDPPAGLGSLPLEWWLTPAGR